MKMQGHFQHQGAIVVAQTCICAKTHKWTITDGHVKGFGGKYCGVPGSSNSEVPTRNPTTPGGTEDKCAAILSMPCSTLGGGALCILISRYLIARRDIYNVHLIRVSTKCHALNDTR